MDAEHTWAPGGPSWTRLFATIDAKDAAGFAAFLTPDGEFRFGNAPPVVGRAAIEAAVGGFFSAIGASRHRLVQTWQRPGAVACEGEVTYTRLDGSRLTVPFVNVFALRGAEIASYRIFIDNSPLFAPPPG